MYTSPLDAKAKERIDFYISIEKVRPLKLAGGSDAPFISFCHRFWGGGGQLQTHHLLSFLFIRISEKQSRARVGGEEGEEECGRSKAPHGCGRRGRISFETESLWDSRRSPGTAGLGCVSADLGMCQLRPPLVVAWDLERGGTRTLTLSGFGSRGGYLGWQRTVGCFCDVGGNNTSLCDLIGKKKTSPPS